MINFSAISTQSRIGRLLRGALRMLPGGWAVPILQGRLRGHRWIVGAGDHGCWLGSYELAKQRLLEQHVGRGAIVFDIGANAGFYTLLFALLVGAEGQVVAFEPLEENLLFLRAHLRLNRISNVRVVDAAVAEVPGVRRLRAGPSRAMAHLAKDGDRLVRAVTLDDLVATGEAPVPDVLKIDVECSDDLVLTGAAGLLRQHHPVVFLATDPLVSKGESLRILKALGYRVMPIVETETNDTSEYLAMRPAGSSPDRRNNTAHRG